MSKNLFNRIWNLLRYPARSWDDILQESAEDKSYLRKFFYPLAGLAALAAFFSPFIYGEQVVGALLKAGIQNGIVTVVSAFAGLFVAARMLNLIFVRWFGLPFDKRKAEILTVYSSTPVLAVSIITRLVRDLFFLKLCFLYVFVIVWEATTHYYAIDERQQGRFTGVSGFVILMTPVLFELILKFILPGLKSL